MDEGTENLNLRIINSLPAIGNISDLGNATILDNDDYPIATNDNLETDQGVAKNVKVLGNDSHPEGKELRIKSVNQGNNGSTSIDDKGTALFVDDEITYTPNEGFVGTDSFIYEVTDIDGNTDIATVNVEVFSAPNVFIDDATMTEGGELVFNVILSKGYSEDMRISLAITNNTTSDSDHEGTMTPLFVDIPANKSIGTFKLQTIDDSESENHSEDLTISITGVSTEIGDITDTATGYIIDNDDSPTAINDSENVSSGLSKIIDVLANDTHPLGNNELSILSVNQGVNGIAIVDTMGTSDKSDDKIIYTPNNGFSGEDSFTYTIEDNQGNQAIATVTVIVEEAPIILIEDASVPEGGQLVFNVTVSRPYGEDILLDLEVTNETTTDEDYEETTTPLTLTIPKGSLLTKFVLLTTDDGFDEGTSETFKLSMISASPMVGDISDTATGTIIDNDTAPKAIDDNIIGNPGEKVEINVLKNDIDGTEGLDKSTIKLFKDDSYLDRLVIPEVGTWEVNTNTGIITFTPEEYFSGSPEDIQYSVKDNVGTETIAKISINYPALADSYSVILNMDESAQLNVLDAQKNTGLVIDKTSVKLINGDSEVTELKVEGKGTFKVDSKGVASFTPISGFIGLVTAEYTFKEENGNVSNKGTIELDYTVLRNDLFISSKSVGETETFSITGNDDSRISRSTLKFVDTTESTLTVSGQGLWSLDRGTGNISFTPDEGFNGNPSSISYTAKYKNFEIKPATVTLTYNSVNSEESNPIALDDNIKVNNQAVSINVLANDTFGSAGAGDIEIKFTQPSHGKVTLNNSGTSNSSDDKLIYTPNAIDFTGSDSFTYTITNARGVTSTATVTVDINNSSSQAEDNAKINEYLLLFLSIMSLLLWRKNK